MKISQLRLLPLVAALLALTACGTSPTIPSNQGSPAATASPTIETTPTRDPCGLENIAEVVKPINDVMLQFDDYATLAQYADKSQLPLIIPNMQTIRRVSRSRTPPMCLAELQRLQVAYMDAALLTLLEFEKPDPGAGPIATGIAQAQYLHQEYTLELARLLGVTITPPAPTAIATP
jgi:hypothetical protein